MLDTTNAASVWAVQSKLLKQPIRNTSGGICMSFTSILIDECNGSRLDEGRPTPSIWVTCSSALSYASRMGKLYSSTQEFQVVLKEGRFGEVGKEFTFKGLAQKVE
jgi:hypothetical protein